MTWPEATYKIIVEGGGGLLTAIFFLAWWTDFFENIFGRTVVRRVEVFPENLVVDLTEVVRQMRQSVLDNKPYAINAQVLKWAECIADSIKENVEGPAEDDE